MAVRLFQFPVLLVSVARVSYQENAHDDTTRHDTALATITESLGQSRVAAAHRARRWRRAHRLLLRTRQSRPGEKTQDLHHGHFVETCTPVQLARIEISLGG